MQPNMCCVDTNKRVFRAAKKHAQTLKLASDSALILQAMPDNVSDPDLNQTIVRKLENENKERTRNEIGLFKGSMEDIRNYSIP